MSTSGIRSFSRASFSSGVAQSEEPLQASYSTTKPTLDREKKSSSPLMVLSLGASFHFMAWLPGTEGLGRRRICRQSSTPLWLLGSMASQLV